MSEVLGSFWFWLFLWIAVPSVVATISQAWQKARKAQADLEKRLLAAEKSFKRSLARATKFWPLPVHARYALIIPTTTEELGGIVHDTADLADFVAFVSSGIDETNGWEPGAPRVYIHLDHFRVYNTVGQVGILAHEFNHAITRPVTGPHVPTWVDEGMANVSGGLPAYNAKSGKLPTSGYPRI